MVSHVLPISLVYVDGVPPAKSNIRRYASEQDAAIDAEALRAEAAEAALQQQIAAIAADGHYASGGPVACATTGNITLSGEQTIDGVMTSGSRVLVRAQSAPANNGIYVSAAGAWARSSDANSASELAAIFVAVTGGDTLDGNVYLLPLSAADINLGVTALNFIISNSGVTAQSLFATPQTITGGVVIQGACTGLPVVRTDAGLVVTNVATGHSLISQEATGDCSSTDPSGPESGITWYGANGNANGPKKLGSISAKSFINGVANYDGYLRINPSYNNGAADSIALHLFKDAAIFGVSSDASAITARGPGEILYAPWPVLSESDGSLLTGSIYTNSSFRDGSGAHGISTGYDGSQGCITSVGVSSGISFITNSGSGWSAAQQFLPNAHVLLSTDNDNGTLTIGGSTTAAVMPDATNARNIGSATYAWGNIYSNNALNVISDGSTKEQVRDPSAKELATWANVRWRIFMHIGGDRLHVGAVANEIYDAFQKEGLDAFDYGLIGKELCFENKVVNEPTGRVRKVKKTEKKKVHLIKHEMKDGALVRTIEETEIDAPLPPKMVPVLDHGGRPVMKAVQVKTSLFDAAGAPIYSTKMQPSMEPVHETVDIPIMHKVTKTVPVMDGKKQKSLLFLRYEQCLAMEAAYQRSRADAFDRRLAALEKK